MPAYPRPDALHRGVHGPSGHLVCIRCTRQWPCDAHILQVVKDSIRDNLGIPEFEKAAQPTCESCRFYVEPEGRDSVGTCHLMPPPSKEGYWPSVYRTEWCGQHEAS
jgi:hypothetical protein